MAQPILVRGAKQLLTLRGPNGVRRGPALSDLGIIQDGSVLIRDGVIAAVGSSRRIENLKEARTAREICVDGNIVMPAFVDASFNLDLQDGSGSSRKRKTAGEFHDEAVSLMRACSEHGTLTAEVKMNGDGPDLRSHFSVFRQIARIGGDPVRLVRTCRIRPFLDKDESAASAFVETVAALARRELAQYLELNPEPESFAGIAVLLRAAEQAKLRWKLLWCGGSPTTLADLLSRLAPLTVACPCYVSSDEVSTLSQTRAIVVFSPGKEAFDVRSAKCGREAVDAGASIALSTGYDEHESPTFNMQMVLSLAVIRLHLTPEEAITAATNNAAYAAGCGQSIGTLEAGKKADLVALNVPDYRELHRQFGVNHVQLAIRDGLVLFDRLLQH